MHTQRPAPEHRITTSGAGHQRMDDLQDRVIDLILERGLGVGDPIPTEHELRSELGVSRNTLREGMKMLQAAGILEIRHGYGTFVADNPLRPLNRALTFRAQISLRGTGRAAIELVEVRDALECGLVPRVIGRQSPNHLAETLRWVERMEELAAQEPVPDDQFAAADLNFHRALFAPLDNAILSELLASFWQMYDNLQHTVSVERVESFADTARAHRAIYDSVASGDAGAAATQLHEHFDGIHELITNAVRELSATPPQTEPTPVA